jgi:hypothetical protein
MLILFKINITNIYFLFYDFKNEEFENIRIFTIFYLKNYELWN